MMTRITPHFGAIVPIVSTTRPNAGEIGFISSHITLCGPSTDAIVLTNSSYVSPTGALPGLQTVAGQQPECAGVLFTRTHSAAQATLEGMIKKYSESPLARMDNIANIARETLSRLNQQPAPDVMPVEVPVCGAATPEQALEFALTLQGLPPASVRPIECPAPPPPSPLHALAKVIASLLLNDPELSSPLDAHFERYVEAESDNKSNSKAPQAQLDAAFDAEYPRLALKLLNAISSYPQQLTLLSLEQAQSILVDRAQFPRLILSAYTHYKTLKTKQAIQAMQPDERAELARELRAQLDQMLGLSERSQIRYDADRQVVIAPDDFVFALAFRALMYAHWESPDDKRVAHVAKQTMTRLINTRLQG